MVTILNYFNNPLEFPVSQPHHGLQVSIIKKIWVCLPSFCIYDFELACQLALSEIAMIELVRLHDFKDTSAIELTLWVVAWIDQDIPLNLYFWDVNVQLEMVS